MPAYSCAGDLESAHRRRLLTPPAKPVGGRQVILARAVRDKDVADLYWRTADQCLLLRRTRRHVTGDRRRRAEHSCEQPRHRGNLPSLVWNQIRPVENYCVGVFAMKKKWWVSLHARRMCPSLRIQQCCANVTFIKVPSVLQSPCVLHKALCPDHADRYGSATHMRLAVVFLSTNTVLRTPCCHCCRQTVLMTLNNGEEPSTYRPLPWPAQPCTVGLASSLASRGYDHKVGTVTARPCQLLDLYKAHNGTQSSRLHKTTMLHAKHIGPASNTTQKPLEQRAHRTLMP
jgi:hypothetical protein